MEAIKEMPPKDDKKVDEPPAAPPLTPKQQAHADFDRVWLELKHSRGPDMLYAIKSVLTALVARLDVLDPPEPPKEDKKPLAPGADYEPPKPKGK